MPRSLVHEMKDSLLHVSMKENDEIIFQGVFLTLNFTMTLQSSSRVLLQTTTLGSNHIHALAHTYACIRYPDKIPPKKSL